MSETIPIPLTKREIMALAALIAANIGKAPKSHASALRSALNKLDASGA